EEKGQFVQQCGEPALSAASAKLEKVGELFVHTDLNCGAGATENHSPHRRHRRTSCLRSCTMIRIHAPRHRGQSWRSPVAAAFMSTTQSLSKRPRRHGCIAYRETETPRQCDRFAS